MRRSCSDERHQEEGSGTLLVLAAAGLVMFIGFAVAGMAAIVLAHRAAQAAADLAALAGASAEASGVDGCASAEGIATANRATLLQCSIAGEIATVVVRVEGPRLVGREYDVTAEARAGPAEAP